MKTMKPGTPFKCPECGRVLALADKDGIVAGVFICPRTDRCSKAKAKEPIEPIDHVDQ